MPGEPTRRLTAADLQPARDALERLSLTTEASDERIAVKALWHAATGLLTRTPPEAEEAAAQEAFIAGAEEQLAAQMAVCTAVADVLVAGGNRLVTSAVKVEGAHGHVVQIGRVVLSGMGPGADKIVDALAELAGHIRDADLS